MSIISDIAEAIDNAEKINPLVHHITNYVTVNDCANITLAAGGSPVMADAEEEVSEMTSLASSLVLNIGTLNKRTFKTMLLAGKAARKKGIPIILDPVGCGATSFRTEVSGELIRALKPDIIKGNLSEIKSIIGKTGKTRGVDSVSDETGALETAIEAAGLLNTVIAVTGAKDFISDGKRVFSISNGSRFLSKLTGTGCMTASLCGVYAGSGAVPAVAAGAALSVMAIAGEIYENHSSSLKAGDLKREIFNNISAMNGEKILELGKIKYEDV